MPPIASTSSGSAVPPTLTTDAQAVAEIMSRRSSLGRVKESFNAMAAQEKGKLSNRCYLAQRQTPAVQATLNSFEVDVVVEGSLPSFTTVQELTRVA